MRFWAIVIAMISGCAEHGQSPPDGPDPATCETTFEAALDRTCVADGDCVLAPHDDCCGVIELGISASSASGFSALEAELQACRPCPPLGCAHPDEAEDNTFPQTGESIVPICDVGRCTSVVR